MGTAAADIGWKALAVNLSDLAAMGATPAWALQRADPPDSDERLSTNSRGLPKLATPLRLALIGGDTTRGPLTVTWRAQHTAPGERCCARHAW